MSKIKLTGHASGTGVLTVTAPNTSTDRTITLPDATGTLATTADTFDPDGAVTINDTGADVDFRVESDTKTHALFVQGSDGNIGVGTSSPWGPLSIEYTDNTTVTTGGDAMRFIGQTIENKSTTALAAAVLNFRCSGADSYIAGYNLTGSGNTGGLAFFTDGGTPSEKLRITSDGRGLSQFTAKAWCKFNGTGTPAIDDSHNCSSLTDNGTGDYTLNFANNMANTTYSKFVDAHDVNHNTNLLIGHSTATFSTSSMQVLVQNQGTGSALDEPHIHVLVFGD